TSSFISSMKTRRRGRYTRRSWSRNLELSSLMAEDANYSDDTKCPKCGVHFDLLNATTDGVLECPGCGVELVEVDRYAWAYYLLGNLIAALVSYLTHLQSVFFFMGVLFYGFI